MSQEFQESLIYLLQAVLINSKSIPSYLVVRILLIFVHSQYFSLKLKHSSFFFLSFWLFFASFELCASSIRSHKTNTIKLGFRGEGAETSRLDDTLINNNNNKSFTGEKNIS